MSPESQGRPLTDGLAPTEPRHKAALIGATLALWVVAVVAGLSCLWRYKSTPGPVADRQERWPAGSALAQSGDRPTLLLFAHPKCDCTRASLAELAEILGRFPGGVAATVAFLAPTGVPADWAHSEVRAEAARLPGVQIFEDGDGVEATRFGAETSGTVLLFAPDGRRLFSGGITGARGHAGDNPGVARVSALLAGHTPALATSPVFGCALADPAPGR